MQKKLDFLKFFTIALTFVVAVQFCIIGTKTTAVYAQDWSSSLVATNFSFLEDGGKYYDVITRQQKNYDYGISTAEQLKKFSNAINNSTDGGTGKTFKITATITLDSTFNSIGSSESKAFRGTFVGGGYTMQIFNLQVPLFGYTKNAKIQNIEISDKTSQSSTDKTTIKAADNYVGGIVCYASNTKIQGCRNNATVQNTTSKSDAVIYTGGIVGYVKTSSVVEQCSIVCNVENTSSAVKSSYVGGIVGKIDSGTVKDCYVLDSTITAKSKIITSSSTPQYVSDASTSKNSLSMTSNNGLYYSTFDKMFKEKQAQINRKTQQAQSLKRIAEQKEKELNEIERKLSQKRAERSNYNIFQKKYWSLTGEILKLDRQLAGKVWEIGVAWGDYWTEIAKLKFEGIFWDGVQFFVDNTLIDAQYLNNYQTATKKVTQVNAYAYGIGYSVQDNKIIDCYTANVLTIGGYENTKYNYYFKFWAQSLISGVVKFRGDPIPVTVELNTDTVGPISNKKVTTSYYLEKVPSLNRQIYITVNGEKTANWFNTTNKMTKKYETWGTTLGTQKLIFESDKNSNVINIFANNNTNTAKTKVTVSGFNTELAAIYGTSCSNSKTTLVKNTTNNFSSSVWDVNSYIENGYPHLQYRYWQDL
ncbi:MAG: hypothetical protein E7376_04840 [Clostridiales bacterium]|nr:hypothetical protein [Clostridiales bacterium]